MFSFLGYLDYVDKNLNVRKKYFTFLFHIIISYNYLKQFARERKKMGARWEQGGANAPPCSHFRMPMFGTIVGLLYR